MRRIPRPSPAIVIALIALVVAIGGTAYATGENRPLLGGVRNPQGGATQALTHETGIIANTSTYGTRQSNKSDNGGGAIYGCRSGPGGTVAHNEPCIRANNLNGGLAFEFATTGTQGGLITAGTAGGSPFTTTATGVASGLNADRVDSLDAAQIETAARTGLVPLKALTFVSSTATNTSTAAARAAATEVPLASFGPFTIYGKCFVDSTAPASLIAETYARTTQDGAMLDTPTGDRLDGDPAFLTTGTAETARQVDVTDVVADAASINLRSPSSTLVAPDGTAYEFRVVDGVKQGTLAGGNGLWGAGDRCAFGFSRYGSS
jgi:hypothetical protein